MKWLWTLIAAVAVAAPGTATSVVYRELGELISTADGIVLGTVQEVESAKDERGNIYTFVTLGDLEVAGGSYGGETLTLQFEGGTVDNETLDVEGSPRFDRQERVILLVEGNGQRVVPIAGWGQGVFRVVRSPETGAEVISDNVGNRVFDVRDGRVIKERRVASQVELFGARKTAPTDSELPEGSFGRTETGEEVVIDRDSMLVPRPDPDLEAVSTDEAPRAPEKAMAVKDFLTAVRELTDKVGMKGKELRSVEIPQMVSARPEDARAEPVEEEKGPAERTERGQRPQPIETETDVSQDPPPEEPPTASGNSN